MKCSPTQLVYTANKCLTTLIDKKPSGPTLPFTGQDLAIIVFTGALLILTGLSLRRLTRNN